MRVKRGVTARAKHKKVLKAAKGMQHNRTRSFRLAKQAVSRSEHQRMYPWKETSKPMPSTNWR